MATTIGHPITTARGNPGVLWIGADQGGNVLDVIAALEADELIVTHVMPHRWKEFSMTARSGSTRVQLPSGAVDADYDDTAPPVAYDETLANELLGAARRYQDSHAELAPGRPSLSGRGTHSPHVSFRVPEELAEQLDEQSAAEGVSRSVLARRALAAYLAAARRAS